MPDFLSFPVWAETSVSFSLYFFGHEACGLLVPWPGVVPMSPAVEGWHINPWTTREVLETFWKDVWFGFIQPHSQCPLLLSMGTGATWLHTLTSVSECNYLRPLDAKCRRDMQPSTHEDIPPSYQMIHLFISRLYFFFSFFLSLFLLAFYFLLYILCFGLVLNLQKNWAGSKEISCRNSPLSFLYY